MRLWLEFLGLGQYADAFERNDIDAEVWLNSITIYCSK